MATERDGDSKVAGGGGGWGPVVSHHPSMRRCEFYYCFPDCMDGGRGGGGGGGNGRAVIHTGWQALDITLNRHEELCVQPMSFTDCNMVYSVVFRLHESEGKVRVTLTRLACFVQSLSDVCVCVCV